MCQQTRWDSAANDRGLRVTRNAIASRVWQRSFFPTINLRSSSSSSLLRSSRVFSKASNLWVPRESISRDQEELIMSFFGEGEDERQPSQAEPGQE